MKNMFVEYNENVVMPYNASSICSCLAQYVKDYVDEEREVIEDVDIEVRDAVLINMINYLSSVNKSHFYFKIKDLYNNKTSKEKIDGQTLLYVLFNHLSVHLFNDNLVQSVLMDSRRHNCHIPFDVNDGAVVLVDFINYVAERNDFDRKFTVDDLYYKYKELSYKHEMDKLKKFLQDVNKYTKELQNGKSIDDILKDLMVSHNLKYISRTGNYYFTDEKKKQEFRDCMNYMEKKEIDKDLYPLVYAYDKYEGDKKYTRNVGIKKKLLEMKQR